VVFHSFSPNHSLLTPSLDHTRNESLDSSTTRPLNLKCPNCAVPEGTLPAYIRRLSPSVSEEDFEYLAKKGALTLPPDELRNSFLRNYVDYVHPFMPILSLRHILKAIDQGTGEEETISLLLFQAIMFAGATFADASSLTISGFKSLKLARRVLFHRARVSSCSSKYRYAARLIYESFSTTSGVKRMR
jgi:hypothetical protein